MKFISLIIFLCFAQHMFAQLSDSSQVFLLTCRAGDDVENLFGHTAIQIKDPASRKNEVFNYGLFSFNEPGFLMKFLRGKLLYSLGIQTQKGFEGTYHTQKRSVLRQELNYTTEQKNNIYKTLRENHKKENRDYLYDFFFDNCSTRPRDILLNTSPGVSENNLDIGDKTFRNQINEFTYMHPWTDFGIDLIIGRIADRKANNRESMFLPEYLYSAVKKSKIQGASLEKQSELFIDYEDEHINRQKKPWATPALYFGLVLLLELFFYLKKDKFGDHRLVRGFDINWFAALGIGGIIILFMWFGTDHIATKQNLNILWLNVLFFLPLITKKMWVNLMLIACLIAALIAAAFFQEYHIASIFIICTTLLKLLRQINEKRLEKLPTS